MATNNILASYSPESLVIVLSNSKFVHTVNGYSDGTFINLTRPIAHATPYTGADATNARVVRNVKNYDITLTLAQTSESNDVFSQLLALDELSRNGDDIFAMTIKDTSGRTVISSTQCFIGTDPDLDFGVEITDRAWVIHGMGCEVHIGGNGKFTAATFDTVQNELEYTVDPVWNPNNVA